MRAPLPERDEDLTPPAERAVLIGIVASLLLVFVLALLVALWRDAFPQGRTPPTTTTTTAPSTLLEAAAEHQVPATASRGITRERAEYRPPSTSTTLATVSTTIATFRESVGYGPSAVYLGRFRVTCYGPPQFPAGRRTASGEPVGPGSIAVDPRIIPRGTRLRVDGVGEGHANDTGSAVKGRHLDVWRRSCDRWANPDVDVWRLP